MFRNDQAATGGKQTEDKIKPVLLFFFSSIPLFLSLIINNMQIQAGTRDAVMLQLATSQPASQPQYSLS